MRRKWFAHQPARKMSAATVKPTAQPPNTADRTVTRTGGPNASWPSGEVTLIVIGNVPDARASTVKRIVLLPGFSVTDWSAPFGKISLALSRCTRTFTSPRGFERVLEAQRNGRLPRGEGDALLVGADPVGEGVDGLVDLRELRVGRARA